MGARGGSEVEGESGARSAPLEEQAHALVGDARGETRARLQPSPILIKEMRSTMRGTRTFLGMTVFLLFLTGITLFIYYTIGITTTGTSAVMAGRTIFGFVAVTETLMLAVITLPLTAGAIASERQNQTFDMLMSTPLTAGQVLRGKLMASMNYLVLLVLAGLPINAVVFLFGGVSPAAFLGWVALLAALLLMLGSLGLLMSTLFKSSAIAASLCYLLCILVFIVFPVGALFALSLFSAASDLAERVLVSMALLHPGAALLSILIDEVQFNAGMLLPAALPLYGSLAALFYLGAEARLSSLSARRWRRGLPVLFFLLVMLLAAGYIVFVPAATVSDSF